MLNNLQVKLHKKVDLHENILRFYGITKIETGNYYNILKYFNLRFYILKLNYIFICLYVFSFIQKRNIR
jgi:hypothetical protein